VEHQGDGAGISRLAASCRSEFWGQRANGSLTGRGRRCESGRRRQSYPRTAGAGVRRFPRRVVESSRVEIRGSRWLDGVSSLSRCAGQRGRCSNALLPSRGGCAPGAGAGSGSRKGLPCVVTASSFGRLSFHQRAQAAETPRREGRYGGSGWSSTRWRERTTGNHEDGRDGLNSCSSAGDEELDSS
jgi:hypothetical protein